MKKIIIMSMLIVAGLASVYNNAMALSQVGAAALTRTHTYCVGDYGFCIEWNFGMPTIIPGRSSSTPPDPWDDKVPPLLLGYAEYNTFFIFTDPEDYSTGIGLINGCIQFEEESSSFYYYELKDQEVITSYDEWDALRNENNTSPENP